MDYPGDLLKRCSQPLNAPQAPEILSRRQQFPTGFGETHLWAGTESGGGRDQIRVGAPFKEPLFLKTRWDFQGKGCFINRRTEFFPTHGRAGETFKSLLKVGLPSFFVFFQEKGVGFFHKGSFFLPLALATLIIIMNGAGPGFDQEP